LVVYKIGKIFRFLFVETEKELYNKNIDIGEDMDYTEKYQEYLNYLEETGNASELKQAKAYKTVGKYNYTNCRENLIKEVIISCNPQKGRKSINPIIQVISNFAKYIGDNNLLQVVQSIDRDDVWNEVKGTVDDRFISHQEFEFVLNSVLRNNSKYYFYNNEYFAALFWCIYEGIYNSDYSLLYNLRACNINGCNVTTYNKNGAEYKYVLPKKLVNILLELSDKDVWETSYANYDLIGEYPDCCFKKSHRTRKNDKEETADKEETNKTNTYVYFYRSRLRKINKEYIKRKLLPQEIFISGIMHRIILRAKEKHIKWQEIFRFKSKNSVYNNIIVQELERSHYKTSVKAFKEKVVDYLYVFEED